MRVDEVPDCDRILQHIGLTAGEMHLPAYMDPQGKEYVGRLAGTVEIWLEHPLPSGMADTYILDDFACMNLERAPRRHVDGVRISRQRTWQKHTSGFSIPQRVQVA